MPQPRIVIYFHWKCQNQCGFRGKSFNRRTEGPRVWSGESSSQQNMAVRKVCHRPSACAEALCATGYLPVPKLMTSHHRGSRLGVPYFVAAWTRCLVPHKPLLCVLLNAIDRQVNHVHALADNQGHTLRVHAPEILSRWILLAKRADRWSCG